MARPASLDLTSDDLPWRGVPMDGANRGIDVVPLASHPEDFVIVARFPAGFVRAEPGGYHAAETFLVLDGELELDGRVVRRGDLTHVPADIVRTSMSTREGCTVLAWFSGSATFLRPAELGPCALEITTVSLSDAAIGPVLSTPEAEWTIAPGAEAEGVDLTLSRWSLDGSGLAAPALGRHRR